MFLLQPQLNEWLDTRATIFRITVVFSNIHRHLPPLMALTVRTRPWRSFLFVVCTYQFHLDHHSVSSQEHDWCQPEYSSLSVRYWHKHAFSTTHTHTHAQCEVGSVSCEWWSVGMKGWGTGNWLGWRIKGLHDIQARTSWLTETFLKRTTRRIKDDLCVYVCVKEKGISPQNRQRPVSRMMCFLHLRSFCLSVSLSSSLVSDLSLSLFVTDTCIQVQTYVYISK